LAAGNAAAAPTIVNPESGRTKALFDPLRLAAKGEILAGELDARLLARVVDRLAPGSGPAPIAWSLGGNYDARSRPVLQLRLDVTVSLICQRCLQPFALKLALQNELLIARDEAELEQLDSEEPEVVLAGHIDPQTLVEDELLLSLPFSPRHAEGECIARAPQGLDMVAGASNASPFARLSELKKGTD